MICNKCLKFKCDSDFEFRKDRDCFRKTCKSCRKSSNNEKKRKLLLEKKEILSLDIIEYSREEFFNYCKKINFNLKSFPIVADYINQKFDTSLDLKTKVYLYYKELKEPPLCQNCNRNWVKLINTNIGFLKFCSPKCSSNSDEKKEKIKKTNLKKWGYVTPLSSEYIKDKIKKTNLEKWGVENVSQNSQIKEKKLKTMIDNFGVEFNSQRPEIAQIISNKMYLYNIENNTNRHLNHWIEKLDNLNLKFVSKELNSIIEIQCPDEEHTFKIHKTTFNDRVENGTPICTVCNPVGDLKSFKERELSEWLKSVYSGEVIESYRDGLEIDIYLPDLKLGIEFNGLFWHSNKFKDKNYHLDKLNFFKERGIRIIHIWEDDWILRKDIIRSQILNFIGSSKKIPARKCRVLEIENIETVRDFLDKNHIQGFVASKVKIGLFSGDELISLMTFDQSEGRKKMGEGEWNLSRFCSKLEISVVGGASKLLHFFIENYKPKRIISYSDKNWSSGNLYYNLGFSKVSDGYPDYKYLIGNERFHKSGFRKSKTDISENLLEYPKIWDCGKSKFELTIHRP